MDPKRQLKIKTGVLKRYVSFAENFSRMRRMYNTLPFLGCTNYNLRVILRIVIIWLTLKLNLFSDFDNLPSCLTFDSQVSYATLFNCPNSMVNIHCFLISCDLMVVIVTSLSLINRKLSFKPHLHGRKFLARLGWKKYAYQKNWFGTDRFSRVNDFGPSVPDQNFTRARTMSRGSPSTDKTGTRSWKSSPARIKCAV